ncbi:hypothetical protein J6590_059780 [Homalodisca vitripennis]|nr:hypothetical protein J6590_059780 [Homalodisca vitripennis]
MSRRCKEFVLSFSIEFFGSLQSNQTLDFRSQACNSIGSLTLKRKVKDNTVSGHSRRLLQNAKSRLVKSRTVYSQSGLLLADVAFHIILLPLC